MSWHPLDNEKPLPEEDQVTNEDLMLILAGEVLPRNLRDKKLYDIERREHEARVKAIIDDPVAYFRLLSTRALRFMFREAQRWQSGFYIKHLSIELPRDYKVGGKTVEQILRSEIASRPRILNKKQSAEYRRKMIKGRDTDRHNGFRKCSYSPRDSIGG